MDTWNSEKMKKIVTNSKGPHVSHKPVYQQDLRCKDIIVRAQARERLGSYSLEVVKPE